MNVLKDMILMMAAAHSTAFALFHLGFWRLFSWREELAKVSAVNRGIMQVLNLCLTFVFAGMAALVLVHRADLLGHAVGRSLLYGIACFWCVRIALQFAFFKRGHWASWLLNAVFLAGAVLHTLPLWLGG